MAAFSTLALIGLAAGAGGVLGKLSKKGKPTDTPLAAPGPTTANTIAAPPPPPTALENASGAIAAGQQAGQQQKRRAMGGGIRPLRPSGIGAPRPIIAPATLIGGGY